MKAHDLVKGTNGKTGANRHNTRRNNTHRRCLVQYRVPQICNRQYRRWLESFTGGVAAVGAERNVTSIEIRKQYSAILDKIADYHNSKIKQKG